jgi:hypothetical protein
MANYTVYTGKFFCQECNIEVKSLRLYAETKTATWMCPEKHISKVSFMTKRKKDYEREKRK